MSASSDASESAGREVAKRLFAREFNDATYTFKESEDELAPNYTLLPTGDRVNRLFFAGTLTETNDVGSDSALIPIHRNTAVSRTNRPVN